MPFAAPQLQIALPPGPEIPVLPRGSSPPTAVVGVLSVPDVLRISTAYQQADRELSLRRQRLNEDAQREQATLRDLGQAFASERGKLSADQVRARERQYQSRINDARQKFGERERIIREAGQYVMAQIDRTLEGVAHQVATSRGVNLVLNRAQLLGAIPDFDLTPQVAEVLNQVLPTVVIPPDGVSPMTPTPQQGPGDTKPTSNAPSSRNLPKN
jgi:Skp family chaperone for outer membrane proteins